MKTISEEEFKKLYGTAGLAQFQQTSSPNEGFGDRLKQAASAGFNKIKSSSADINSGNPLRFAEGALRAGAGAVETAFSPISAAIEPITKPTIGRAVNYAADKISNNPSVQKFANSKAGQVTSRIAENVNNLNTIAGAVAGVRTAPKVATGISNTTNNIGTGIKNSIPKMPSGNAGLGKAFQGARNVAEMALAEGKRIPERIATNVAERQAVQQTIKSLPTQTARKAAQDGLDIADIQTLYKIPKVQKSSLKQLADVVRKFANGETKVNPIEVVGKPIVTRIKELEKARGSIGARLGNEAKKLGVVTTEETIPAVFGKLKKVSGLDSLKLTKKGELDFRNTVLTTAETAADRRAIQSIYTQATRWGTGAKKHLLRQELFEILGGKKRSLTKLTATQEKAYQAVREGLSDVLGNKNLNYKKLSNDYRKVMTPLEQIRKVMRVAGESDDIMNMSAGLLARRLTSAAQSNPQIRAVLNAMDKATAKSGKARLSVETLQDFYNILEKYYDIAPKTGFQAQVRQGVEKAAGSPLGYITEQIQGFAGETPAVRQRALENILKEVLN